MTIFSFGFMLDPICTLYKSGNLKYKKTLLERDCIENFTDGLETCEKNFLKRLHWTQLKSSKDGFLTLDFHRSTLLHNRQGGYFVNSRATRV